MADQVTPPKGTPRWIKILLSVSLAANLLIVGLAAGTAWRVSKGGPPKGPYGGLAYIAALEKSDRRAMFKEMRGAGRDLRAAGRADSQQMLAVLRAEPFDSVAFDALLADQSARNAQMQDRVRTALSARLAAATPEDRAAYADRLEERLSRGGRKKGKPRD